jgi:hypothetical protein
MAVVAAAAEVEEAVEVETARAATVIGSVPTPTVEIQILPGEISAIDVVKTNLKVRVQVVKIDVEVATVAMAVEIEEAGAEDSAVAIEAGAAVDLAVVEDEEVSAEAEGVAGINWFI